MERYLKSGDELILEGKCIYKIMGEVGRGASCIVYLTYFVDSEGNKIECLLKEYNPKHIELYREETGELCLDSEDDKDAFEQGMKRFEEGYRKQISFRRELPGLKNETSNVQRIHSANGTKYIEMTCNEGSSYEKVQEASLHDLLCRIKELARIIGNYHNAGLLHLDIKPQNIFSVPGKCETVLLFDFDSVVSKEDVLSAHVLSCTQTWAAPEQIARRRDSICEATDIFAIGAILFAKIYGYPPEDENKRSFAKYTFDYEAGLFKNVNPKGYKLLEEILHRTICRTVKERYQSTEELIKVLDDAIRLADPKEPYLKTNLPTVQNFFVGRDSELEEIHQKLQESNVLFVSGVGGIGKSELVKNYAKKYREEYDAVIFAPVVTDILSLITSDRSIPVYNFSTYAEEQVDEYYERKLAKIKELSDERTLLIMDNLDAEDGRLQDVLGLGSKVLITTRRNFTDYGYEQLNVLALQNRKAVFALFENYYTKELSADDREKVEQIIELVDGHTMTVELLAKQMLAGRVTPAKMLEKLEKGMQDAGREKVKSGKDGQLANRSAFEHIQALFDLSGLSEKEKYVLGNLSLLPSTSVPTEVFHDWCELEDYETINGLKDAGWVRMEENTDYISLHPVVAEVAISLVLETSEVGNKMLAGLADYVMSEDVLYTEKQREFAYVCAYVAKKMLDRNLVTEGFATLCLTLYDVTSGYGRNSDMVKCVKAALDFWRNNLCTSVDGKVVNYYHDLFTSVDGKVVKCYHDLGRLIFGTDDGDNARMLCRMALELHMKNSSDLDETTAKYCHSVGITHYKVDNQFANEYYERAISILLELDVVNKKKLSRYYLDLAESHRFMKNKEGYESNLVKGVEIAEQLAESDELFYGDACYELGRFYIDRYDANRDEEHLKNAGKYLHVAEKIRVMKVGKEHKKAADSYLQLGEFYSRKQSYEEAENYYLKAICGYEKTNSNFYDLARAYRIVGSFYRECMKDEAKAAEFITKAQENFERAILST